MSRRTAFAVATTALCAIALAACSSGGDGSPSSATTSAASPSTSAAPAANAASIVASAHQAGAAVKSAHVVTTTVIGGKSTTIRGDVAYRPTKLAVTLSSGGKTTQEILVGSRFYLKLPAGLAPAAKPWFSISVKQMAKLTGIDFAQLFQQASPDQTLQLLGTAGSDLTVVGSESVGGVQAQHLSGTVDLEAALDAMTATQQGDSGLRQLMEQAGVKSQHIDLWVNARRIPIKVVTSYTSKIGDATTTMLLTKIDAPVHIVAPPASKVAPFGGAL